jgi:hypothetical protein
MLATFSASVSFVMGTGDSFLAKSFEVCSAIPVPNTLTTPRTLCFGTTGGFPAPHVAQCPLLPPGPQVMKYLQSLKYSQHPIMRLHACCPGDYPAQRQRPQGQLPPPGLERQHDRMDVNIHQLSMPACLR